MIHSIWIQLVVLGFGELEASSLAKAEAAGVAASRKLDDEVLSEFFWHAASGKRLRLSKETFTNPQVRTDLLCHFLILSPHFYITHWLLKHGGEGPATLYHEGATFPPLSDWLNPEFSPVMRVLQHYSGMLLCVSGRSWMIIFWILQGKSSEQFFESESCQDSAHPLQKR